MEGKNMVHLKFEDIIAEKNPMFSKRHKSTGLGSTVKSKQVKTKAIHVQIHHNETTEK
jgi:hypothetical protein